MTFDTDINSFTFDEVHILNGAHVAFSPDDPTVAANRLITINKLVGSDVQDVSSLGTLHVGPDQSVFVVYSSYYLAVNLNVYKLSKISLPDRVKMYQTTNYINGTLYGARDLTLVDASLYVSKDAMSASGMAGNVEFGTFRVLSNAKLYFTDDVAYEISGDAMEIGPGGQVMGREVIFKVTSILVDEKGHLDFDAQSVNFTGKPLCQQPAGLLIIISS